MKPQVVASECCAGRFPQNTLAGFEACLESRFDGIELDVHLSKDGHVVVHHDYHLNPRITRNSSGVWLQDAPGFPRPAICDLTLAEIRTFDVGRYHPDSPEAESYPDYQPMDGQEIPTLEALLKAHQAASSDATLWVELKTTPFDRGISSNPDDLLVAVLRLIEKYRLVSQTVLLAFEWQPLVTAQDICPGIGTDYLTINPEFVKSLYKQRNVRPQDMYRPVNIDKHGGHPGRAVSAVGGGWWGPFIDDITAADVDIAHVSKVAVNVWGVASNAAAIEQALQLGVDAITLSDAGLLQQKLEAP